MSFTNSIDLYYKPLTQGVIGYFKQPTKRQALIVGMWPWRNQVKSWIYESNQVQIQRYFGKSYFNLVLKPYIKLVNPVIYLWGYKAPTYLIDYIRHHNLDVFFLEDGFIRSAPDADKLTPPLSIIMDSQTPYFDTTRPNDMTELLGSFDFEQPGYDESIAKEILNSFVLNRISKYNNQPLTDVRQLYGPKEKKRILVLGQVPHDDSLKYGGGLGISLLDLTKRAIKDNPNAQVIVKPHPMILGNKMLLEALKELNCLILYRPLHLVDALQTIDHVYTITSLGGFEALLRGKKVTVLGQPFYKGYGLTEDETNIIRPLSKHQIFYIVSVQQQLCI